MTNRWSVQPDPDDPWLAAVLAAATHAIIGTALDGTVVIWNDAAQDLLGYDADEVIGFPRARLTVRGETADIRSLMAQPGEQAKGDHARPASRHVTWRRKDGSILPLQLVQSPIYDAMGHPRGLLEVACAREGREQFMDETSHVPPQDGHQDDASWRRIRFAALRHTVAFLAHQLGQPVTAISGYLQACKRLLEKGTPSAVDRITAETAIDQALGQLPRLSNIVRCLRISAGRGGPDMGTQSLAGIVEHARALMAVAADGHGVDMVLDLAPEADLVRVADGDIELVLLQLMTCALGAMDGLDRRRLVISTSARDEMVGVVLAHTGRRRPPAATASAYGPVPITVPDEEGGSLSVCRAIVNAQGGRLWSEDDPTGRATTRFTLRQASDGRLYR